jgi:hypothetical protein
MVKKYLSEEKSICSDVFSKIFKTSTDKNGDARVNFEMVSNAIWAIMCKSNSEEDKTNLFNLIVQLTLQEDINEENDGEKGSNLNEFIEIVSNYFLPAGRLANGRINKDNEESLDAQLENMFNELKSSEGFIGTREVRKLLNLLRNDFPISQKYATEEELRQLVMSAAKDERGMNYEEFVELMKSERF